MLSDNCSEWSTGKAYTPYPTVVKWRHTIMWCVNIKKVVAGQAHKEKKIRDGKIDKYTYLGDKFTAQSNIHDRPFLQT